MSAVGMRFTNDEVIPIRNGQAASFLMGPNLTLPKGTVIGQVTAAAVNEVQSLAQSSGTTGAGTFKLAFNGQITDAIPYNATAAQVQAALRLLSNIGSDGVVCTGGALPGTPIVITFGGALAGLSQNLITVYVQTGFDAGVYAVTRTTAGVSNGRFVAYAGTQIADPTTGILSLSGTGAGGAWGAGTHVVQAAWANANGSTKASLPQLLVLTAAQSIRVAAINAANTPDDALYLDIYVNGTRVHRITVTTPGTGGNVLQTDIADVQAGASLPLPTVNTAFTALDGSSGPRAWLRYDTMTDERGRVTYGTVGSAQHGGKLWEAAAWIGGNFRFGDLVGMDASARTALGARFIRGSSSSNDSELLIPA